MERSSRCCLQREGSYFPAIEFGSSSSAILLGHHMVAALFPTSSMPLPKASLSAEPYPDDRIRALEAENARLRRELTASGRKAQVMPQHMGERELRSVLDHMPAMIGYWDKDLRNRFCNRAYLHWFGTDPAQIRGMHIREVIGEDRYRLNQPYIEGVLRGEAQIFERAIPVPDGSGVRHSLANYIPDIVDGQVQGFFVLVTETTALHDTLVALRASEERYRAVIEDQTEMISRMAADGSFSVVNDVYCRFFGKTAEELIGQAWTPVCHPEDVARVKAELRTLSPDNPTVLIENRVYSGSGEVCWIQFVNRGFFDDSGRLLEIQSVGRDVTERKNAELALHEANALMEKHVIERTEQLRRLTIERALAEDSERQSIARDLHDGLGQLLHVVKIKLDALLEHVPGGAADVGLELNSLLANASRQVRSITTQLSPPVLSKLGLSHALSWLGEEMLRHYGLRVEVSCTGSSGPLAAAQASILFRCARELLINAAKHSKSKQARVALMQTAEHLSLTVEDDGTGIADMANALSQTQGFGLASIRERLTYLGGKTEILNALGAGLRVTLLLPLAQSPSRDARMSS